MDIHAKLEELNLTLPPAPKGVASYLPALQSGNHVFVSGQLPLRDGKLTAEGQVPSDVSVQDAQAAMRQCVLNGLATVDQVIEGDWSRFVRIVRLAVFVNTAAGFTEQHIVANGGSDLLNEIFGDAGKHVRAAVGVAQLPLGAAVEAEMIVEVR